MKRNKNLSTKIEESYDYNWTGCEYLDVCVGCKRDVMLKIVKKVVLNGTTGELWI